MERGPSGVSAVDEVRRTHGVPVVAVATLDDLVAHLAQDPARSRELAAIQAYRDAWGSER